MRRWILLSPLLANGACGPGRVLDSSTTGDDTGPAATSDTTGGQITTGTATSGPTPTSDVPGSSTGSVEITTGPATPDTTSTTGTLPDPTSGSTTTDTGETGTGSSTGGVDFMCITGGDDPAPNDPDPCACILDDEPGPANPWAPTCGEGSCDMVLAEQYSFELINPDALQCALVALRDRKPGLLQFDLDEDSNYGRYRGYILILDDATAIVRRWGHEDLSFWVGDAVHVKLPDPCAFEQCLAEPFDWKRFDCLAEFPYEELGVCDEGWGGDF